MSNCGRLKLDPQNPIPQTAYTGGFLHLDTMRYPTRRYGNQHEFEFQAQGIPIKFVAKQLRRSERTVQQWLTGVRKMPWWVPEILRLQRMEHEARLYQMNIQPVRIKLGLVTGSVIAFPVTGTPADSADSRASRSDASDTGTAPRHPSKKTLNV
jgi:hypothetical protein